MNPEASPASVPVSDGSESARIAGLDPQGSPAAAKVDWDSVLGKRVRVWDGQHSSVRAEGEVIGIITAPTLCIRLDDGTRAHESSDLPVEYVYAEWRPLR